MNVITKGDGAVERADTGARNVEIGYRTSSWNADTVCSRLACCADATDYSTTMGTFPSGREAGVKDIVILL